MRSLEQWMNEYGKDHQNKTNRVIHRICVPAIFFSVVGFFHLIPFWVGDIRGGDIILLIVASWYAFISWKALMIAGAQLVLSIFLIEYLQNFLSVTELCLALGCIFVVAWVGQFYGHHLEGRRPSFLKDLQYLLIGPIWIFIGYSK